MDLLLQHLKVLGLTEEESKVYINAVETHASTILEFAQNTGIPRTTVYLLVESLMQKELLTETVEGKRKRYIPASPKELISLAQKKEEEFRKTAIALEERVAELEAIYNRVEGKPHIQYKEGHKGMKEIVHDSLQAEQVYIHFTSEKGKDLREGMHESYLKHMVATIQIVRNTVKNQNLVKEESTSRNQIVLLDEAYAAETDYMIYRDTVVFITYKNDNPHFLIVKDQQIAFFEKTRFNLIFKSLK